MGAKLQTITIDSNPANVAAMMARGFFHSHQDGRWRYSPFGGETTYCNDPTERFPLRAEFPNGWSAAADPGAGIFARIYSDGTRGLDAWGDGKTHQRVAMLYAPRHEGERQQREWIERAMTEANQ